MSFYFEYQSIHQKNNSSINSQSGKINQPNNSSKSPVSIHKKTIKNYANLIRKQRELEEELAHKRASGIPENELRTIKPVYKQIWDEQEKQFHNDVMPSILL